MTPRGRFVRVVALFGWLVSSAATATHTHAQEPAQELPPLVYVCPMHSDQVSHEDGECPICHMGLEPMRLDQVYTCPVHSVVAEKQAGKCPICGRTLGEVTVSVAWRCSGVDKDLMEPQQCTDGTHAVRVQRAAAHGNHNPQHGGQFFMAQDYWHHVEGTYPSPGVFRLFVYDDYTRPISRERLTAIRARLVTKEETDQKTFETREVASTPLTAAEDGPYLEARIDPLALPADVVLQAAFTPGGKEQRFDFSFAEFSTDTMPAALDVATRLMMDVPDNPDGILEMLVERRDLLTETVARGGLSEVWVPALQGKDLALALELHAREFQETRRARVAEAVHAVVLAAFRLDSAGDRGERDVVDKSAGDIAAGVTVLEAEFGGKR
ncbi:MAG: heavy metal-binding domain-containing protein [Vicinamibacterales bacterium]